MLYIVIIQAGQATPSTVEVLTENSVQVTLSHNFRENVKHVIIQADQANPSAVEVLAENSVQVTVSHTFTSFGDTQEADVLWDIIFLPKEKEYVKQNKFFYES